MMLVALVIALVLEAIGLGLASLANTEAVSVSNYRQTAALLSAAEAGAEIAMAEAARQPSFTSALAGSSTSAFRDVTSAPRLASGERLDLAALTAALQAASDAELRRGANNPRWRLFLYAPLSRLVRDERAAGYVAAWIADDAAEVDDDPLTDANETVVMRAQAFGPKSLHRTVETTLARDSAGLRLVAWREVR